SVELSGAADPSRKDHERMMQEDRDGEVRELVERARELLAHGRDVDAERRAELQRIEAEARSLIEQAQRLRVANGDGATVAGRMLADDVEAWLADEAAGRDDRGDR